MMDNNETEWKSSMSGLLPGSSNVERTTAHKAATAEAKGFEVNEVFSGSEDHETGLKLQKKNTTTSS